MFSSKDEFQMEFSKRIVEQYGRGIDEAHITEKFMVLESMVRDYASINWAATKEKGCRSSTKTDALFFHGIFVRPPSCQQHDESWHL